MQPMNWVLPLIADAGGEGVEVSGLLPGNFWPSLLGALLLGLVGIVLASFGVKIFDMILRKIDLETELAEKQNLAVAIVVASFILGVFHLVATVVH